MNTVITDKIDAITKIINEQMSAFGRLEETNMDPDSVLDQFQTLIDALDEYATDVDNYDPTKD